MSPVTAPPPSQPPPAISKAPASGPVPIAGWGALHKDLPAGLVVFLVALPLCLGVALASNAPLSSGLLAGVVGGVVVGLASGSHTSVAGPAAGLTAIVVAQVAALGSFRAFLVATVLAGALQVVLGLARTGFIAAFFPSSVIKGLLAAIGLLLILKQLPHVLGHDSDPLGDMAFSQPDRENTFTSLLRAALDIHPGAALLGIASVVVLVVWSRVERLKRSVVPAPLVVVALGVLGTRLLSLGGGGWVLQPAQLVNVPMPGDAGGFLGLLESPDWSVLSRPAVYVAAVTLALFASLETLVNLEAADRLDTQRRRSPPSRELVAQGLGNMLCGLVGGLPVTSVIARSSVNVNAGSATRQSTVAHGALLGGAVLLLPALLNQIPLSCLAAILVVTGVRLASPMVARQMWAAGRPQFWPFAVTVGAIVFTDLLTGIIIGLLAAVAFILRSNQGRPIRRVVEKHLSHDVLRIELANQVSFLNRAALERALDAVPSGGHVLIDARETDYIDPDILDLLDDFTKTTAPAREIEASFMGFRGSRSARVENKIQFVDHTSREARDALTPERVLELLRAGNRRFELGERLTRDLMQQVGATALGQSPMAVVLSCIDSRAPIELLFDLGIGDVFSIRIAGNVARSKVLGSMEYAAVVAGAKVILVLGHTRCGAVTAAVEDFFHTHDDDEPSGFHNLGILVGEIRKAIHPRASKALAGESGSSTRTAYVDEVARRSVARTMAQIRTESPPLDNLVREGRLAIVGGMYDIHTGQVRFFAADGEIDEKALAGSSTAAE